MKRLFLTSFVIFFCIGVFFYFSLTYEYKIDDLKVRLFKKKVKSPVVFIKIDQNSIDFYHKNFNITWPWPRVLYAKAIKYLQYCEVKAICFDMIYSEPSFYGTDDDEEFVQAVKSAGSVFFPLFFSEENREDQEVRRFAVDFDQVKKFTMQKKSGVLTPLEKILRICRGAGYINHVMDMDGIYRRLSHFTGYKNRIYPSFPLAVVRYVKKENLDLGKIPFDNKGRLLLKYYERSSFVQYPIVQLIQSQVRRLEGKDPVIPLLELKDKIVIIGASAPGLLDLRPTPVDSKTPGFFINGTALINFLNNDYLRGIKGFFYWLLIFTLVFLLNYYLLKIDSYIKQITISLATLFILGFFNFYLYLWGYLIKFLPLLYGVIFTSIFVIYYRYQTAGKEKRFLKRAFQSYLSESLLKEVLKDPQKLNLGGESKRITIFFSDLAGFTTLSEKLSPQEVVNILNLYLERMTQIVIKNKGYLNKFEGDAIMAFWGAPIEDDQHSYLALKTALESVEELKILNKEFLQKQLPELAMRIGINTGRVIVGNIGSKERFEYTVIGDSVNLAARLEGINKMYGTGIICGKETRDSAGEEIVFRYLDQIVVKGKFKPVKIFEVVGFSREISEEKKKIFQDFQTALEEYFKGDFKTALPKFSRLRDDQVSEVFLRRCEQLIKDPPKNWQGIHTFTTK